MNKRHNKIIKSIVIALAIIMSIVVIVFGASKFISKQINNENALNYGEYRIQENEINFTNKNTGTELTDYTGEEVVVSINPGILDTVNKNKDDDKKMIVQYQLTELNDTNGVDESKWNDYKGPFSVDHNVRVNARLYSKADESFAGPVTNKDITKIAVAKIVNGSGNNAKITYYRNLADAINAWPEETGNSSSASETNNISTKIEMVANTKENVIMPQGKNIVLDVAGFKISSENETPTITINGKCKLINSKTGIISESVVSITNTGVKINSTGEFILGTNENGSELNVSTTTPVIKGKIYGIQVEENGKFRFYDGKIIAPADEDETKFGHKAIYGTNPEKENSTTGNKDVYETPQKYIVNIEKDENGNEIATLAKTYVITFDADGGETSITTKIVVGNKEYGELPVANKVGYEFVKWTYEEKTIEPSTIVTTLKDHTLKANYTPNTYKISFNANTASGKLADISATYDNETQLPTKSKIIMSYVKNGYSFKNWNTQSDGKGTSYEAGEIVKNLTQINNDVVILYAIWEDTIEPENQAPTGISTTNTIKITCNQTDDGTGIDENSIQYAIGIDTNKNGTIEENEWSEWQNSDTFENLNFNTGYSIRTKASDKAGNGPVISEIGNIKTKNIENAVLEVYKDNETSDQITPETDANNKSNPINTDLKLIVKLPKTDNSIKDDSTNGTSTIIYITSPDGDIKTYQNGNEEGIISNSDGILNINVTTKTGTYEIKITTTDGTNTVEDKFYVFIDKTAPTIIPVKTSTTNSITVTANAGDEDSGVKSVTYILKDEQGNIVETNLTGKFVNLKENTKYNVEIIVVDNAGNIGTTVVETATKSLEVGKLEFSGVINKQIIPALKSSPQTSDEKVWTNENVNVKITKPDDVTTTYIVSKNDEIVSDVYSENTQIATVDGDYVVKITTTDGTNTKIENYYFSVDKTAPVVVIEPNGKIQTIAVGNNQDNITVTLTVFDEENGSGVVSTKYAVSESNVNEPEDWADFVSGVSITQTKPGGVYYIWTNVVDKAGNRATGVKVSDGYDIGYAVEYDVNGGIGTIEAQRKVKGSDLTLTSAVPTRDGYLFKGWASSKTATSAEYSASGVYGNDEAVRLYAVWSEVVASATVGNVVTYYDSVQGAIDSLKTDKGTVTLIKDEVNESVVVAAGQDVVLDTDGKTLSSGEVTVTNNGTLVIQGGGVISSEKNSIVNRSIVTIEECNIKSETSAISNSGNMIVNDATIETAGIGVFNYGDFIFNSGSIISEGQYTISNEKNVTISGGTIENKYTGTAANYTIICHNRDKINGTYDVFTNVTMTGGLVKAPQKGNQIAITTSNAYINGTINVSGGTIESTNYGIQNCKGDTNISGGVIGGGIGTITGNINIIGGTIKKNISINGSGTLTMGTNDSDVSTENPVVSGYIYVSKNGKFNFYDGIIKNKSGNSLIDGTVTATPAGYSVVNGTETIDGEIYDTAYLSNQYTVTFDTNGGNEVTPANKIVTYGTTYGELPIPTKTGYTFTGWKLDGTETIITSTTQVTTASAHTLIAQWTANEYTITFDPNNGTVDPATKTVTYDGTYGKLPTPTREGYTFNGWYDSTNTKYEETTKVTITANQTLTAKWTAKQFTVTFNPNGGTVSTTSKKVTYDSAYGELPTPTKTGYTFAGWYDTTNKKYDKTTIVKMALNHTLTAKWNVITYNLTYDLNGGAFATGVTNPKTYTVENKVTLKPVSKVGYVFVGWQLTTLDGKTVDNQSTINEIPAGTIGNRTYKAIFENGEVGYKIHHMLQNADDNNYTEYKTELVTELRGTTTKVKTGDVITLDSKQGITIANSIYEKSTTTKDGAQGTSVTVKADGTTEIYVYYKRNTFALTITAGENTKNAKGSGTYKWGQKVTISASYENLAGYTYSGFAWTTTDTSILGSTTATSTTLTMPAEATSVTATATKVANKYTVTFDANGGVMDSATSGTTYTQDYGSKITMNPPTKEGYEFLGWVSDKWEDTTTTGCWTYANSVDPLTGEKLEIINDGNHRLNGVAGGKIYTKTPTVVAGNYGAGQSTATATTVAYTDSDPNPLKINSQSYYRLTRTSTKDNAYSNGPAEQLAFTNKYSNIIYVIVARLPIGWSIQNANNLGLGSSKWLTSQKGTGKWETYVLAATSTEYGVLQNTGHFCMINTDSSTNTGNPTMDVAYLQGYWTNVQTSTDGNSQFQVGAENEKLTALWREVDQNVKITSDSNGKYVVKATNLFDKDDYSFDNNKIVKRSSFKWSGASYTEKDTSYYTSEWIKVTPGATYKIEGVSQDGLVEWTEGNKIYYYYNSTQATDYSNGVEFKAPTKYNLYTTQEEKTVTMRYMRFHILKTDKDTATLTMTTSPEYTSTQTLTFPNGANIEVQATPDTGYHAEITKTSGLGTFETTTSGNNVTGTLTNISGPVTTSELNVKFTGNTYTVNYNGNGATSGTTAQSTHTYGTASALTQNGFVRAGHTFKGWSTTPDATTAQYTDKETVTKLVSEDNGEITLYAIWEANEYTVTYDYGTNGGQVSETDTTKTTTAKIISGNSIDLKKIAYKQGYKFLGWSESPDSTNIVKSETMGNSDKTYYAIFGKLEIDTESINIDLSENTKNTINITGENYGNLTYEIEDETVVSVSKNTENENAEITGLKNGTTKITVISSIKDIDENALKAEVTVTVVTSPTNIKITPKTSIIGVKSNNTVTISGEIEPVTANIENKITYVSNNPEIATVDENTGVVKGVANGSVTITATTENGKSDVANVVVDGIAPEITITKNKYNQFTWTATDNSKIIGTSVKIGDSEPTTWTSRSDENITDVCVVENAGKYHVWAKDEYGNISNETIDAYSLTRSQGTNSSLVTKVDVDDGENAGNTGVDITDSITAVLPNTKIYASASGDIGYSISLKNGDTEIPVSGSVIDVNDNITITSIAKENSYNISYELNGGKSGSSAPVSAKFTDSVKISAPSRSGYEFTGWKSSENDGLESSAMADSAAWDGSVVQGTSITFKSLAGMVNDGCVVKLTACWRPTGYDIIYELNGGTAKNSPSLGTFDSGVTVSVPSKTGYKFMGWTSTPEDGLEEGAQSYNGSTYVDWDGSFSYVYNSSWSEFKNLVKQDEGERKTVKLTANWIPETYNITYDYKGGTAGKITQSSATLNEEVRISTPSKTGYTFKGWTSTQEDGLNSKALMYGSNKNYSSWDGSLSYTFTFNSYYSGSYFKNLAPQEIGQEEVKTVKLTANWVPSGYDIEYELNGGTSGTLAPTTGIFDSEVHITVPKRTGYKFMGWTSTTEDGLEEGAQEYNGSAYVSWDGSLSTLYNSSSLRSSFKNLIKPQQTEEERKTVKLTANWIPETYNITYDYKGGTAGKITQSSATLNEEVRISTPSKTGYTFAGWTSTQEDGLNSKALMYDKNGNYTSWDGSLSYTFSFNSSYSGSYFKNLAPQEIGQEEIKTVKLTANWRPNGYDIVYELNGGTAGTLAPTTASFNTEFRIYNPTKSGYTFLGWTSSQEDGLEDGAQAAASSWSSWNGSLTKATYFKNLIAQHSTGERKAVKFTANWVPGTYNITYDYKGGTAGGITQSSAALDEVVRISKPSRTGYTFAGWTSSQEDGLNSKALMYDSSGNYSSWDGSLSYTFTFNSSYSGSYFKNLAPQEIGQEEIKTVKLTANWKPSGYDIIYELNGGTAGSSAPTTGSEGSNVSVSAPTKSGYTFAGWTSSKEDGLCEGAQVNIEGSGMASWNGSLKKVYVFKNLATQNIGEERKTVKLTANWKPNGYDIIYELNGGTAGSSAPTTGSEGLNVSVSAPTKSGYTFAGWTSSKEDGLCEGAQVNIEGSGMASWNGSLKKVYVFKNLATQNIGEERKTVKLTANWAPSGYDIEYELNGGTAGAVAPTSASFNTEFRIYNPTKSGCTFLGWTSSKEDGLGDGAQAAASSWSSWNGSLTKGTYFKNLIAQHSTGERKTVKLTANWQETSTQSLKTKMLKNQGLKNQVLKNQSSVTGNSVGGTENEEISSVDQTIVEQPASEETSTETSTETPTEQTPVAQINETTYETLSEAINSSNNQDKITILKNLNIEEITIESDKNITINLNGKTITSTSINTINNKGTLTITGPGIIKNEIENGTVIYNTGTINIENNAQITATKNGGKGISCSVDGYINENSAENQKDKSGILNIKSGKITTEGIGSIGIYSIKGGTVNIIDGSIETTGFGGKAIYNNADLKINKIKILIDGDDSVGIYNSRNSKTCVLNNTEITIQKKEIENYEIIKNTNEFKAQLEKMKPSYGIYNDSNTDVTFETGVIKIERLKGIGIKNNFEGSVTLGKEDETINSASPIIYAISDNTTAIINNENGEIRFYDGKIVSVESVKKCFTNLLKNSEIVEETGNSNIVCYLKMCE